jgi:hypothetical protein
MAIPDFDLLAKADADSSDGLSGRWRTLRRLVKRSILDQQVKNETRFFCQNSGACGSHYIVDLLRENLVDRVFHEKDPDLNQIGVTHFDSPISKSTLVSLLRYTRHNVFFEANNRLFSLSKEISAAFPNAKFIHLFRHPAHAVRSAMSKPEVVQYLKTNLRFAGSLAGDESQRPLERFCIYWMNVNKRIDDDLVDLQSAGVPVKWLSFDRMVSGDVSWLGQFIDQEIETSMRRPSHVGAVRSEGKFPEFENWNSADRSTLERICMPLFQKLSAKAN